MLTIMFILVVATIDILCLVYASLWSLPIVIGVSIVLAVRKCILNVKKHVK